MSVLIDLGLVCAVCLQDKYKLLSIFEHNAQDNMTVAEKIAKCSELEIKPNNKKVPNQICQQCLDDLNVAWRFRQHCEIARSLFRSLQIQDNEMEAEANMALREQKIKLPSGLKIKKIHPESKTYLLPMKDVEYVDKVSFPAQDDPLPATTPEQSEQAFVAREEEIELDDTDLEHYETVQVSTELEDGEDIENILDAQEVAFVKSDGEPSGDEAAISDDKILKREPGRSKKPEIISSTLIQPAPKRLEIAPVVVKKVKSETPRFEAHLRTDDPLIKVSNRKLPVKPSGDSCSVMDQVNGRRKRKNEQTKKICEICGNCYKYQHALNAHMRRHTNEKPFRCEFCEKAFVSGVELRRHMRVHTGQKPYPCKYCDRAFSDFGSRIKHERTHTGERPYVCSTCGKAFAYAHVLSVHIRTHTGEKRFQCTSCSKGFTKKAYLLAHMELHKQSDGIMNMRQERAIKQEVSEIDPILDESLSSSMSTECAKPWRIDEKPENLAEVEFEEFSEKQEQVSDSDEVFSVTFLEEHLEDTRE